MSCSILSDLAARREGPQCEAAERGGQGLRANHDTLSLGMRMRKTLYVARGGVKMTRGGTRVCHVEA